MNKLITFISILLLIVPFVYSTSPAPPIFGYTPIKDEIYYGKLNYNEIDKIKEADYETFEVLPSNKLFAKDKNNVYYSGEIIKDANSASFVVFEPSLFKSFVDVNGRSVKQIIYLSKDDENIYQNDKVFLGFDAASFEYLGYGYFKDKNAVYWLVTDRKSEELFQKIENADSKTFEIVTDKLESPLPLPNKWGFAKDKNSIYCNGHKIPNSDSNSFKLLSDGNTVQHPHGKDKNAVYLCWMHNDRIVVKDADPETFTLVDERYGKDKNSVFYWGSKLYNSDPNTFIVFDGGWAKDGNNVYNYGRRFFMEGLNTNSLKILSPQWWKDDRSAYYWDSFSVRRILQADVATFDAARIISPQSRVTFFAKDKNSYYYALNKDIVTVDRNSITEWKEDIGNDYSKDQNFVYDFLGRVLDGADPQTFEIIPSDIIRYGDFARDNNNVYRYSSIVPNTDPETFEIISKEYSKDTNNVFYYTGNDFIVVNGADADTFEVLEFKELDPGGFKALYHYSKDRNSVFANDKLIKGADPKSFEILLYRFEHFVVRDWGVYAKDKEKIFYENSLVEGVDYDSFEVLDYGNARDKNGEYTKKGNCKRSRCRDEEKYSISKKRIF